MDDQGRATFVLHEHRKPRHHFDLRLLAAAGLIAATWRTWVHYTVGGTEYRMPLALSFGLIGTFLWIAENTATFLGAWRYPDQMDVWRMVHLSKLTSWTLLVSVSFVLAAAIRPRVPGKPAATDAEPARADTPAL